MLKMTNVRKKLFWIDLKDRINKNKEKIEINQVFYLPIIGLSDGSLMANAWTWRPWLFIDPFCKPVMLTVTLSGSIMLCLKVKH